MRIQSIGYNHPHDKNFIIDRPSGSGSWLFLLIKTPAIFEMDGVQQIIKKNSILIYQEKTPQYYRAIEDVYIDDWFHFSVDKEDQLFFENLKIPVDTPVPINEISEITFLIRNMTYEFYSTGQHKEEILTHYLKLLFYIVSEKLYSPIETGYVGKSENFTKILTLRADIYNMPQKNWSIPLISKELTMSRSSLQHTYKKIFGSSIMEDVINSRLNRVRYYLSTSQMTLKEITEQCGYTNEIHLIRQFKQRFHKTPSEFRTVIRKEEG